MRFASNAAATPYSDLMFVKLVREECAFISITPVVFNDGKQKNGQSVSIHHKEKVSYRTSDHFSTSQKDYAGCLFLTIIMAR